MVQLTLSSLNNSFMLKQEHKLKIFRVQNTYEMQNT